MVEAELSKAEIRTLSRGMDLPTWDKPAQACLSSRIPYGTPVTVEALTRIAKAEEFLHDEIGIRQLRVRHHDTIARIEVEPADFLTLTDDSTRAKVTEFFRSIGYSYVTLDLEGFRSGSLNEVLAGAAEEAVGEVAPDDTRDDRYSQRRSCNYQRRSCSCGFDCYALHPHRQANRADGGPYR